MISQTGAAGSALGGRGRFTNRLLDTKPGTRTLIVPPQVYLMKVVLLGPGGSGALAFGNALKPGAGAGGGFTFDLVEVNPGDAISYTNGAGGAAPTRTGATNAAGAVAGNNGGTTSVTIGTKILQATGGQGGLLTSTLNVETAAVGGLGSGGLLNRQGGKGGDFNGAVGYATAPVPSALYFGAPGGGSSGSPFGDGFQGGSARTAVAQDSTPLLFGGGAGGAGWGGRGGLGGPQATSNPYSTPGLGGGSAGAGEDGALTPSGGSFAINSRLGGRGRGSVAETVASMTVGNNTFSASALRSVEPMWFDVDEIGGAGGGVIFDPYAGSNASLLLPLAGGDGAGGAGSFALSAGFAAQNGRGGFGGGAGGCYVMSGNASFAARPAGIGGGGGAFVGQGYESAGPVYAGSAGGDGAVLFLF